jgi:hypothetical protein
MWSPTTSQAREDPGDAPSCMNSEQFCISRAHSHGPSRRRATARCASCSYAPNMHKRLPPTPIAFAICESLSQRRRGHASTDALYRRRRATYVLDHPPAESPDVTLALPHALPTGDPILIYTHATDGQRNYSCRRPLRHAGKAFLACANVLVLADKIPKQDPSLSVKTLKPQVGSAQRFVGRRRAMRGFSANFQDASGMVEKAQARRRPWPTWVWLKSYRSPFRLLLQTPGDFSSLSTFASLAVSYQVSFEPLTQSSIASARVLVRRWRTQTRGRNL